MFSCFILIVVQFATCNAKCESLHGSLEPEMMQQCKTLDYRRCKTAKLTCYWDGPPEYDGVHPLELVTAEAKRHVWTPAFCWTLDRQLRTKQKKEAAEVTTKPADLVHELLEIDQILLLFKQEYYGLATPDTKTTDSLCDYAKQFNALHALWVRKGSLRPKLPRKLWNIPTSTPEYVHAGCDYIKDTVYTTVATAERFFEHEARPWLGLVETKPKSTELEILAYDIKTVVQKLQEISKPFSKTLSDIEKKRKSATSKKALEAIAEFQTQTMQKLGAEMDVDQKRLESLLKDEKADPLYIQLALTEVNRVLTQINQQLRVTIDGGERTELAKVMSEYEKRLDELVALAQAFNQASPYTAKGVGIDWKHFIKHPTTSQKIISSIHESVGVAERTPVDFERTKGKREIKSQDVDLLAFNNQLDIEKKILAALEHLHDRHSGSATSDGDDIVIAGQRALIEKMERDLRDYSAKKSKRKKHKRFTAHLQDVNQLADENDDLKHYDPHYNSHYNTRYINKFMNIEVMISMIVMLFMVVVVGCVCIGSFGLFVTIYYYSFKYKQDVVSNYEPINAMHEV